MQVNCSQDCVVSSRLLSKEVTSESRRFFMVSIENMQESRGIDENRLREMYKLTDREVVIIRNLFKGLRNAEIAQELFISEITVKKHLQNIFQKMGVKNRTAVIRRILEDYQEVFWVSH
jgi:DNA-binding NarL/FixJ family response regulator